MLEQILKIWAMGWRRYGYDKGNVIDAILTLGLVVVQVIYLALFGIPYWGATEVRN